MSKEKINLEFEKIKEYFEKIKEKNPKKLIVLGTGGAFSPVHKMHIESFQIAKSYLESLNYFVIAGFLVPAPSGYVNNKLKEEAISLKDRNKMIELSIKESGYSSWLYNLDYGFGSHQIVQDVTKMIEAYLKVDKIECVLLVGGDKYEKKNKAHWKDRFVIIRGDENVVIKEKFNEIKKEKLEETSHFFVVNLQENNLSSTLIRKMLKNNQKIDENMMFTSALDYLMNIKKK